MPPRYPPFGAFRGRRNDGLARG